jgi:hypothetical protein
VVEVPSSIGGLVELENCGKDDWRQVLGVRSMQDALKRGKSRKRMLTIAVDWVPVTWQLDDSLTCTSVYLSLGFIINVLPRRKVILNLNSS